MECKGLFVFKSLILRPAGTFKDAEGKDIEYPASYILKVDQIEENDDVNERKFKVNTKDKELINKLSQFKIYDNIVLIFKITLYTSKMSMSLRITHIILKMAVHLAK